MREPATQDSLQHLPDRRVAVLFLDSCSSMPHCANMLKNLESKFHPAGCLVIVGSVCRNDGFQEQLDASVLNTRVQRTLWFQDSLHAQFDGQCLTWPSLQALTIMHTAQSSDQMAYTGMIVIPRNGCDDSLSTLAHLGRRLSEITLPSLRTILREATQCAPPDGRRQRSPTKQLKQKRNAPRTSVHSGRRSRIQRTVMNVGTTHTAAYEIDAGQALLHKRGTRLRTKMKSGRSSLRRTCPRALLHYHGRGLSTNRLTDSADGKETRADTGANNKKRKRIPTPRPCPLSDLCGRPTGHVGRCSIHRHLMDPQDARKEQSGRCARSDRCDRPNGHVGRCSKRLRCARSTGCDRVSGHVGRCNHGLMK